MILIPFLGGTKCHVLFFIKAEYSKSIASFQCLFPKASFKFYGSPDEVKQLYLIVPSVYTFGFRIPDCSRVLGRVIISSAGATPAGSAAIGADEPGTGECGSGESSLGFVPVGAGESSPASSSSVGVVEVSGWSGPAPAPLDPDGNRIGPRTESAPAPSYSSKFVASPLFSAHTSSHESLELNI
jgi:hypothetical protein